MSTIDATGSAKLKEMLERALAFTERLLSENARLRRSLAGAHAGIGPIQDPRISDLEAEVDRLKADLARRSHGQQAPEREALERELAKERRQRQDLEQQNNSLANLYVASYQLHSTLDFKEVVAIVMEIVVNLIGAEKFAILMVDGRTHRLQAIAGEGVDAPAAVEPGAGTVGRAASTGEPYFRPADQKGPATIEDPLAAIPLKIKDRVIGVISVWQLFPQKHGFEPLDHELFKLLAGHAATAIFSAKLYGDSERKLQTIQGFLDLLTTG